MFTKELKNILNKIEEKGGNPFIVGGFVRDTAMKVPSKDIDIEVFNMNSEDLIDVLKKFGKVDLVGMSFGVIKLTTKENDFDFSLPRTESKNGNGHKGFIVEFDPNITPEMAAKRRDFTFNAMFMNSEGEIIDLFDGLGDIKNNVIKHTSESFSEDPLRVLRGFQFVGRFNMKVHSDTIELSKSLKPEFKNLPTERVWMELWKWATKSTKPSRGIEFLKESEWIEFFPEIENLIGCQQDSEWHPEGDAFVHTMHVIDESCKIAERDNLSAEDKGILLLAALCHDMGKPEVTQKNEDGRWISPDHANPETAESFLKRIGAPRWVIDRVSEMVREHMVHLNPVNEKSVRRIISRINHSSVEEIIRLIESDHNGRPPLAGGIPENAIKILEIAKEIGNKVEPILMGRHLIEMGIKPGPKMGNFLKDAFEAQIEGEFFNIEEAIEWAKSKI